jgi:histidine triad (HIT) family protein
VLVFEDEATLAFMDIRPSSPGHTLVIPKIHVADIFAASDDVVCAVAKTVRRVARAVDRAVRPEGMRIAQLNRAAAGQSVFHYHVHLVPAVDGNRGRIHGRSDVGAEEVNAVADLIRKELRE